MYNQAFFSKCLSDIKGTVYEILLLFLIGCGLSLQTEQWGIQIY